MNVPSVSVVLNWRNGDNKSGYYSIHIRFVQGRTARYFKVPVAQKVREEQWAGKDNAWVKPAHPFAFEINNKITEIKSSVNEYIRRCLNFDKPVSIDGILKHLTKKGDNKSFLDFMDVYVKRPPKVLEPNTIKKYSTTL